MRELGEIQDLVGRAGNYASLRFSTDTADPARGALLQRVQERATPIETKLLFFELEWAALDDERAEELLATEGLDFCRHYLRTARRYRPHLLSEPEEKILAEKAVTGRSAWARLFEEQIAAHRRSTLEDGAEPVALEVALARLHLARPRGAPRDAPSASPRRSQPGLRTRAYIFNTLLADKAVDDRLRYYPHWLASRNLANEASDESVEALVEAVRSRYELPRRWYRLKAQLLGLDRLADYDRMAAVTDEDEQVAVGATRATSCSTPTPRSRPSSATLVQRASSTSAGSTRRCARASAAARSAPTPCRRVHPYVMLNYTSRRRDVLTLAHELGHGVHAALGAPARASSTWRTPLTLAETASVFGETLVFGRLLEQAETPESRLALLAESIEGSIATVFRQIAMNRFEHLVHTARREEGELAVDRFDELWARVAGGAARRRRRGHRGLPDLVVLRPALHLTPGYVYAYAYGQLLALSVYGRYEEEGEAFVPAYLELLARGRLAPPEELGAIVGIDLADPGFWDRGLDLVERQLEAAEAGRARRRAPLAAGNRQQAGDDPRDGGHLVDLPRARRRRGRARSRWCRTITVGMPRGEKRRMSAPYGTPASGAAPRSAATAAGTARTHGCVGRRSPPEREGPPVQATSTGGLGRRGRRTAASNAARASAAPRRRGRRRGPRRRAGRGPSSTTPPPRRGRRRAGTAARAPASRGARPRR